MKESIIELEKAKTSKSNKIYVIPECQIKEFMGDRGPNYTKLCAEALLVLTPTKKNPVSKKLFQ